MRRLSRRQAGRQLLRIARKAVKDCERVLRQTELRQGESEAWSNGALKFCWLPGILATDKPVNS